MPTARDADTTLGIYAHIPFCARRCDYCDFFVLVGEESGREAFFDALSADLEREAAAMSPRPVVRSVYLGGGTPSSVPPSSIARLLGDCRRHFDVAPDAEITLEANPETVDPSRADGWLEAGVNRLSLGVQSLDDRVLPGRGRMYTAAQALDAMQAARAAGFSNLGVDLIAGLPGETPEGFHAGLVTIAGRRPDHVSVYLLETEEAGKVTPLARAIAEGRARPVPEDDLVAMYLDAIGTLTARGYRHYEISNFALPGRASRHNLRYWRSEPYLGVGPSAHSLLGGRRLSRPADMTAWMEGRRGDETLSDPVAAAREALVMQMRLVEGVDLDEFAGRWGYDPRAGLARELADLVATGLASLSGARLALTRRGLLLSNEAFGRIA